MESAVGPLSWTERKVLIRVWLEKTRSDAHASIVSKSVADLIWSVYLGRSLARNFPRIIRVWVRTLYRDPSTSLPLKLLLFLPYATIRIREFFTRNIRLDESRLTGFSHTTPFERKIAILESYGNEGAISAIEREEIADRMAQATNELIPRKFADQASPDLLKTLLEEGITGIPELTLSPAHVDEIKKYLEQKPVYGAHVPVFSDGIPRQLSDPESRKFPFGSYELEDAVGAPVLLDLAFHPKVLALAEAYMGCAPSLYSVHSWWSFPGHSAAGPQVFHRDSDDFRFLALFIFLTDVEGGRKGGEHDFIQTTHRQESLQTYFKEDPKFASEFFYPKWVGSSFDEASLYKRVFKDKVRTVTGKAGSVFLADTFALHRGVKPTESGRLVCWIRYGLRKNLAYTSDKFAPVKFEWNSGRIENNAYNRFVGRLVLKNPDAEGNNGQHQ